MGWVIGRSTLEFVVGDIASQPECTAVVNAANAALQPGGGVAGAIHRAAGPGLADECRPLAPIKPGEAVLTAGHRLPNRYVIHCLGPVYGVDVPSPPLLRACYRRALQMADQHGIDSVAFPAISTGAFGYPMEAAAEVAMDTMLDMLPRLRSVKRIRFVLMSDDAKGLHERVLLRLQKGTEGVRSPSSLMARDRGAGENHD